MPIDRDAILSTLVQMGEALSAGDAARVSAFWDVPGLVLADEGSRAVAAREEVEAFFRASIAVYREQGTPVAKPELVRVEAISERLFAVDVDWLGIDADGVEKSREASHYILRFGDDGVPRVHVAMSRTRKGGQ